MSTGFSSGVPLNSTDTPTTAVPYFVEASSSKVFRIVFFSLTTFAALLGNTVVCRAVFRLPSRTPLSYSLVTNLAAAEIINSLCTTFAFIYLLRGHWPFGDVGCALIIPLQVTSMFVVTSTLAAIAVYRYYFIVVQPLTRVSPRKTKAILVLLWAVSFLFCLPLFMYHKQFFGNGFTLCLPSFPGDDIDGAGKFGKTSKSYVIARFVFNFVVPCVIMVLAYGAVALKLKGHVRRTTRGMSVELLRVGQAPSGATGDSVARTNPADNTQEDQGTDSQRIIELEHDLMRMFYLVIVVFVLFYIPYQVVFMYQHFGGTPNDYVSLYLYQLANLSSALHPLCYGTMSKFYARSFSRLVLCKSRV